MSQEQASKKKEKRPATILGLVGRAVPFPLSAFIGAWCIGHTKLASPWWLYLIGIAFCTLSGFAFATFVLYLKKM